MASSISYRAWLRSRFKYHFGVCRILQYKENAKGVAYPAINDDRVYLGLILISISPLAEQRRIVAKIEELISLIKNM